MAASLEPGPALQYAVEQFLYEEAALLDDRQFEQWLALFSQDIRYLVPSRMNRLRRDEGKSFAGPGGLAHIEEGFEGLKGRVQRLYSGQDWAEMPPSRTRRLVANVRLRPRGTGELEVRSNFLVYRSRLEHEVDLFAGWRLDVLRHAQESKDWRIALRTIYLDQTVMLASNMSILF